MASASDTTSSTQRINNPLIKEEWKRNFWKQSTVAKLLTKDKTIIELRSKEKRKRNPKTCSVHKSLLCFYSPYHDRLLNGGFSEALVSPTEPLAVDSNASILQLFCRWLYTGSIDITRPTSKESDDGRWSAGITKLYNLADELNCVALQRAIISLQVRPIDDMQLEDWSTITSLSNSSLESSGLYRYHLEAFAQHWNGVTEETSPGPCSEKDDPMPPNFAYRLLMKRIKLYDDNDDQDCACCHDPCKFHGHISEEEREATCGAPNDTMEDPEVDCDFDTDPDTESDSEGESEDTPRNESAVKKRSREDGGAAGSKTKHAKTS
ncbi:hypothetical protein KCU67_g7639, partial [Aureobasidium melanogenum]